jgi:hypothetical protein
MEQKSGPEPQRQDLERSDNDRSRAGLRRRTPKAVCGHDPNPKRRANISGRRLIERSCRPEEINAVKPLRVATLRNELDRASQARPGRGCRGLLELRRDPWLRAYQSALSSVGSGDSRVKVAAMPLHKKEDGPYGDIEFGRSFA